MHYLQQLIDLIILFYQCIYVLAHAISLINLRSLEACVSNKKMYSNRKNFPRLISGMVIVRSTFSSNYKIK